MSDIKISVETTTAPGSDKEITIIRVDGVIDTMTASELEKVANSLLGQRRYNIIIDLGGVDYISSAGWGIFISNIREIRLNNGDIKLARMIPNVYEIFELLEFDSILKAFDNIEKAKSDFSGVKSASGQTTTGQTSESSEPKPVIVGGKAEISQTEVKAERSYRPNITMGSPSKTETSKPEFKPEVSSMPLADSFPPIAGHEPFSSKKHLEDVLMEIVGKDPFLSISEINKAANREFPNVGFFKTWWTLRRLGLNSKKKRFYFARTRRFTK